MFLEVSDGEFMGLDLRTRFEGREVKPYGETCEHVLMVLAQYVCILMESWNVCNKYRINDLKHFGFFYVQFNLIVCLCCMIFIVPGANGFEASS